VDLNEYGIWKGSNQQTIQVSIPSEEFLQKIFLLESKGTYQKSNFPESQVYELNAFSYSDLKKAIELVDLNGPRILLFNTVKLANVKNYESKAQWHAGIPNSMELNDMLNMINIKLEFRYYL